MDSGAVRLVPGGHAFRVDEEGEVDRWSYHYDIHNGPSCVICSNSFCDHCQPEWRTEKCPEYHEAIADLEFPIVGAAA